MFCPPQTHNDSSFPTSSYGGCPCALWGFRCMSLPAKNSAPTDHLTPFTLGGLTPRIDKSQPPVRRKLPIAMWGFSGALVGHRD